MKRVSFGSIALLAFIGVTVAQQIPKAGTSGMTGQGLGNTDRKGCEGDKGSSAEQW